MQFQRADLRHGRQGFDPVDLHVGRLVAAHLDEIEQVGHARHRVTLEKLLSLDAVRRAHQRAGTAGEMRQHPFADLFIVAGEIEFGHRLAVARIGPQRLVGF